MTGPTKLCVAQARPVKGDIQKNIENHKRLIDLARAGGADAIIFPELSLTGYEPTLAAELATGPDDRRFDDLQRAADAGPITIGVGVPTRNADGICISMVLIQPHKPRRIYSKQYIHADEEPFFIHGPRSPGLIGDKSNIALAICYELSVPEHSRDAFNSGAQIYVASVVKTPGQVARAIEQLADIARKYSMPVLMANSVGEAEGHPCGGRSSIWNNQGELLGQLDASSEGILILDTQTQQVIQKTVSEKR